MISPIAIASQELNSFVANIEYQSMRVTEMHALRAAKLLKRCLCYWSTSHRSRQRLRQRLGSTMLQQVTQMTVTDIEKMWSTVHQHVGINSFHPDQVFRREGKHRMAKEYQNHRRMRLVFGRWMMATCIWKVSGAVYSKHNM